jgi:hypothetical protein
MELAGKMAQGWQPEPNSLNDKDRQTMAESLTKLNEGMRDKIGLLFTNIELVLKKTSENKPADIKKINL